MKHPLLVIFTHGSRDPRWLAPFEQFEMALRSKLGQDRVRLAHMEVASPTLMDVAAESEERGVGSIRLLPLFMAGGGHVAKDIPKQVAEAMARFPGLHIEILPAIGEHPLFVELMCEIALEGLL